MKSVNPSHFGTLFLAANSREYKQQRSRQKSLFARSPTSTLVLSLILVVLSGCVSTSKVDEQPPAEVEERVVVDGRVLPLPEKPQITTETLGAGQTVSPVVADLLDEAINHKRAANYDAAADTLERALRIEPRNALVWHELADLRFNLSDFNQAIQFAQKSNTLTRAGDANLQRRNWKLISTAYAALGNSVKAAEYRAKL